mgnify:CR=1 FL=1
MKTLSFPSIKLGEHIKQIRLKVKDTELNQANLTVYGVTNTGGVSITNNKVSENLGNYIVLNEHQFAYNPYRINVGSIGLTPKETFGIVSPAYVVFETDEHIDSEFLLYYLKSSIGINLIKWYGDRGGVRATLRYSDLEKIDFPNISLEKQLSILSKIKKIESRLELIVAETVIGDVEKLRQSILQQAVEGKLCEQNPDDEPASVLLKKIKEEKNKLVKERKIKKQKDFPLVSDEENHFKIPCNWEWCRINDISFVTKLAGFEFTKYFNLTDNGAVPVIRAQNVRKNRIDTTNLLYIDMKTSKLLNRCALDKKCLLMTFIGAGIGDVAIFEEKQRFHLAPNVAKIELYGCVEEYILYFLLSTSGQKEIFKYHKATAQPSLSMETIREICVPIPPLAEQQRIVEKVNKLMLLCDELEKEVNVAQQYASQIMESVLQEAFSDDKQIKEEQAKQKCQVISIQSEQKAELRFAMAARGTIKQSTLESLQKRAIEIANGEK